jgi:hypothetical protein
MPGISIPGRVVASFRHGKQRRTKTRKEEAEEGSAENTRDPEYWPRLNRSSLRGNLSVAAQSSVLAITRGGRLPEIAALTAN